MSTSDDFIRPLILSALMSLDQCYRLYGPNLTLSSYNGGKDACVIMSLHRAAHANYFRARKEVRRSESNSDDNRDDNLYGQQNI